MSAPYPAIPIRKAALRLNAAAVERYRLENNVDQLVLKSTPAKQAASRLLDECCALEDLIIASSPTSLTEAAIQGAVLFYGIGRMLDEDDAFYLKRDLRKVQLSLGGIVRALVAETRLDLNQIGETDLARYLDAHAPPAETGWGGETGAAADHAAPLEAPS
ncbi:MAG TPA: hypothetical protein VHB27_12050 [Rhodopila sp.]|uniref:hypothetical protein n=1 Tax=Rhodopila sp. TaxID=2480087 RepID=UPI002C255370|nr:hypothetical protein [Rhodopila sp.]HVY15953.1 hypothetical protein [Rhodopila sp.]